DLDAAHLLAVDGALAVDGLAEGVDHAAEDAGADGHGRDAARALDLIALADLLVVTEERDADVVLLEVEHDALHVVGALEHLAGNGAREAIDAGDAVAGGEHRAGLHDGDPLIVLLDLLADDLGDLFGPDFHRCPLIFVFGASPRRRPSLWLRGPLPGES